MKHLYLLFLLFSAFATNARRIVQLNNIFYLSDKSFNLSNVNLLLVKNKDTIFLEKIDYFKFNFPYPTDSSSTPATGITIIVDACNYYFTLNISKYHYLHSNFFEISVLKGDKNVIYTTIDYSHNSLSSTQRLIRRRK